jgi:hypothetical protein
MRHVPWKGTSVVAVGGQSEMTEKTGGMPAPTRSLGQYEVVREIGRGGMATVYLARQIALDT